MRSKTFFLLLILSFLLPLAALAEEGEWRAGEVITLSSPSPDVADSYFEICLVDDSLLARMRRGGSFPKGCTVSRDDLRYLRVLHYNFDGLPQTGEMVCNKAIAADLIAIFKELFRQRYQIFRMVLIDDYGASDELSMQANNSSCFCFRGIGGGSRLSKHARGMAVDINPLQNPCVTYDAYGKVVKVEPTTAKAYVSRRTASGADHRIDHNDLCYKLFVKYGFRWGGDWRRKKDYQHFEK